MNDFLLVSVRESRGDFPDNLNRFANGDLFAGRDDFRKRAAFDKGHRDEMKAVDFGDIENRTDVRVSQGTGGACFTAEPLQPLGALARVAERNFESDFPVQLGVVCEEDGTHRTSPQALLHFVPPQLRRKIEASRCHIRSRFRTNSFGRRHRLFFRRRAARRCFASHIVPARRVPLVARSHHEPPARPF